jgi:hypothetical protein
VIPLYSHRVLFAWLAMCAIGWAVFVGIAKLTNWLAERRRARR